MSLPNGHAPRPAPPATPDRLPPQNLEAERGALGSMMLDRATVDDVAWVLRPEEFYRDPHQVIYRAILDVHSAGVPVDSITVEEELRRRGELEKAGGLDYLLECLASVPHAANARYYARIVKEKAVARRAIDAGNAILRDAYADRLSAEELVEAAERAVYDLGDARGRREPAPAAEEAVRVLVDIDRLRASGVVPGVPLGWPDVDEIVGGLRGGQLVIVAARPSAGKTAFAVHSAVNVADGAGLPSLFVSLEMGAGAVATRMLSLVSEIGLRHLRDPRHVTEDHVRRLGEAQAWLAGLPPVFVDDTCVMSAAQVASSARRFRARHGVGVVFVDYLQLVAPGDGDSRQEQVAAISRRMKTIARELDVPVVVLSQLNRKVEDRDDRRPRMSDLRESGAIENDADVVILLHRPEYYDPNDQPGIAEVIVAKNRDGPTGTAKLCFRRELTRFDSLAPLVQGPDDRPY